MKNLRVVDASIIPKITSANTQAPAFMVAERASEFILNDLKKSRLSAVYHTNSSCDNPRQMMLNSWCRLRKLVLIILIEILFIGYSIASDGFIVQIICTNIVVNINVAYNLYLVITTSLWYVLFICEFYFYNPNISDLKTAKCIYWIRQFYTYNTVYFLKNKIMYKSDIYT